jgi:hypothetical protein
LKVETVETVETVEASNPVECRRCFSNQKIIRVNQRDLREINTIFFPLISPMIADHSWQPGISAVSCGICGKRGRDAWRNGGHPPVVGESPPPLAMAIKEDADHGKFFAFPFSF